MQEGYMFLEADFRYKKPQKEVLFIMRSSIYTKINLKWQNAIQSPIPNSRMMT